MALKILKTLIFLLIVPIVLSSCKGPDGKFKLPGGDARKTPADPAKRIEQNLKEGKGFQLNDVLGNSQRGGVFDFASSNELWRASLDVGARATPHVHAPRRVRAPPRARATTSGIKVPKAQQVQMPQSGWK